jgi:hypothetical protein
VIYRKNQGAALLVTPRNMPGMLEISYETSQRPFLEILGTPDEHKKHVLFDGGHFAPRHEVMKEILDWLDRYLGPVRRS